MSALARHIPLARKQLAGWPRLCVLHLRSRGVPLSVALVIAVAALYGLLRGWAATGSNGGWGELEVIKQFALLQALPVLIAGIAAASTWSPFGEPERIAAMSLPRLRGLQLALLLALAVGCSAAWLLTWESRAPGIDPAGVGIRNLLGMTGLALLAGRLIDARLCWLAPMAMAMLVFYRAVRTDAEILWNGPAWVWSGRPDTDLASWAIAVALFIVGGALFLRDGSRDTPGEEE